MEKVNKLPLNFFTKIRTNKNANNNTDDKIYPIKWSKEVMKGKKEVVVSLSKKKWGIMKPLNIGDIIVINQYISPDNKKMNHHSFVIVNDTKGELSGIEINLDLELKFDFVATVMSSIKNKKHRSKIEKYYPKDMIVHFNDTSISNGNKKDGFIKANQLYYFQKDKIKYTRIGKLNLETLNKLLDLIRVNEQNGDIIVNYNNLNQEILNN